MKWYDYFSNFYDSSLENLYAESRKRAVELLDLEDGLSILDVACGTGANFKHINATDKNVDIYGTDFSEGMLKKAHKAVQKNLWKNVRCFQADARVLTPSFVQDKINKELKFDRVICFLGLSVMPEWELVMDNMLSMLKEGGRIVIVDVFAEKRDFNTWLVEKIAKADLDRKIWQTLEPKVMEFHYEHLPVKERKVGGKLFVATGIKKN